MSDQLTRIEEYLNGQQAEEKKRRNRLLSLSDLRALPMPEPIIDGVLFANQETVLFGPQGAAKTALLLDMMLCAIFGRPWMGRPVTSGKFVYVCGEGGGKVLANRIDAWLKLNGETNIGRVDNYLRITEYPVHMLDDDSVEELLELLEPEGDILLVSVDTLSANFGAGDENNVADMGQFLNAIRKVRLATQAGVLVVHHTGHHDHTRPQGSNKIRRDMDVELLCNRDQGDEMLFGLLGGGSLKSKNGRGCGMVPFRLEEVELDEIDEAGNPLTSVAVVPTGDEPSFEVTKSANTGLGRNQVAALRELRKWAATGGQDFSDGIHVSAPEWVGIYKAAGLDKHAAKRVKDSFVKHGRFTFSVGGWIWNHDVD